MAKCDPKDGTEALLKQVLSLLKAKGDGAGVDASISALIERQGDRNKELTAEIEELRQKLPGAEDVVLTGDAVAQYNAYREFGKPSEITKQIEAGAEAIEAVRKSSRLKSISEAADVYGYHAPVLERLLEQDGMVVARVKTDLVDGDSDETTTTVFVRKGEDGDEIALDKYAGETWKDMLPALVVDGDPLPSAAQGDPAPRYPRQSGKGGGRTELSVEERMEAKRAQGAMSLF